MKRIFDCTAVLAVLFLFGLPMLLGPAGQAYLAWSGALLVRSGGGWQRDFQNAEVQDDADRYACGCDALIEKARCASDSDRSLSEKIEPG